MDDLVFAPDAFKQYIEWQTGDKKTLKRINLLINDIQLPIRSPISCPAPNNTSQRIRCGRPPV
ncbi:hypothetical protein AGMMS50268_06000 [Spirochaetia bacterium]|nr:hypothetical protein AGMMS50268_06000 [Spirochaetia bacterium]